MEKKTLYRNEMTGQVIPLSADREIILTRPLVMGILNVTPDSFSDGGRFEASEEAVAHALQMIKEGADVIDIGGESTRPGAEPVDEREELGRVIPVIREIRLNSDCPISIDTYKASVAEKALEAGADIINDISALRFDKNMVALAADRKVPVILMHMLGEPRNMQKNPHYEDCVREIGAFFEERVEYAVKNGVERAKIILDPGIGFGKRLSDNIELLNNLREFKKFELPLLVGASRKSFIKMLHPVETEPSQRLGGSLAAAVAAVVNGADIVRVHDVAETVEALKVIQALKS